MYQRTVVAFILLAFVAFTQIFICNAGAEWGDWGTWSKCSRPCGGGITIRNRTCTIEQNDTNVECGGEEVEYQMCNIQDCPEDVGDFRNVQCSAYNNKKFKGKLYRWAAFLHRAGECELNCMPKDEFFYVTFNPRVIDGTRCNDFSNDVCIAGSCVPVGCDKRIHSNATIDLCGVCNGDNSSCMKRCKTYSLNHGAYDYVDIAIIPTGATSIRIKELGKSELYLVLTSNGGNIINGNRLFSTKAKQKYRNNVLSYQRTQEVNEITINGPTDLPIDVKVFVLGEATNNIKVEYYLPTSYTLPLVEFNYVWIAEDWNECSRSCATGTHSRKVFCANSDTRKEVKEFYCDKEGKPASKEECNILPCPARWYISDWAPCSKTCEQGRRTRRVHCVQTIKGGNIGMLNFSACPGDVPRNVETCVERKTCPKWTTTVWSECSKTCGEGIQIREVGCKNVTNDQFLKEDKCSEYKPTIQRSCFNAPCGATWHTEEWGECSSKCGKGIRSRQVKCKSSDNVYVPSWYCNPDDEPIHFKECKSNGTCQPTWQSDEWSRCSAKCGRGMKMRRVVCSVANGNRFDIVASSRCDKREKPAVLRKCFSEKPCHVRYIVSKWTNCSSTCGVGYQRRKVWCFADQRVDHENKHCKALKKPLDFQVCYVPCEGQPSTNSIQKPTASIPKTSVNCVDEPNKANCVLVRASGVCNIPFYQQVCCATCN